MFHAKHRLRTACIIGFVAVAVFTAGCAGDNRATDLVRIGANLEMTGSSATLGQSAANGAKLAIKEVNAKGGVNGKQLTLVVEDNKSDAAEAANAMQKLLSQDKVAAVIAPIISSSVIAAAPINEQYKVAAISPAASNPTVTVNPLTKKVREFVFRAAITDPFQGSVMANFASRSLKAKTAAIYFDNTGEYGKNLARYFEETFVKNGGRIVGKETYLPKDSEYKATLSKIKNNAPDVLFLPGTYQEVGMIVRQAREMGLSLPILGGDGWDSVRLPEIATAKAMNNCFFSNHFSPDEKSPVVTTFVQAYQTEYNAAPDAFAALAYDAVRMVVEAMQRAGGADPVKIRDELRKTDNFAAVSGTISLNETHDPVKSAVIIEMKDGKQLFREKMNP